MGAGKGCRSHLRQWGRLATTCLGGDTCNDSENHGPCGEQPAEVKARGTHGVSQQNVREAALHAGVRAFRSKHRQPRAPVWRNGAQVTVAVALDRSYAARRESCQVGFKRACGRPTPFPSTRHSVSTAATHRECTWQRKGGGHRAASKCLPGPRLHKRGARWTHSAQEAIGQHAQGIRAHGSRHRPTRVCIRQQVTRSLQAAPVRGRQT